MGTCRSRLGQHTATIEELSFVSISQGTIESQWTGCSCTVDGYLSRRSLHVLVQREMFRQNRWFIFSSVSLGMRLISVDFSLSLCRTVFFLRWSAFFVSLDKSFVRIKTSRVIGNATREEIQSFDLLIGEIRNKDARLSSVCESNSQPVHIEKDGSDFLSTGV